jgi:ASC-1-like (ASCH) protein
MTVWYGENSTSLREVYYFVRVSKEGGREAIDCNVQTVEVKVHIDRRMWDNRTFSSDKK